MIVDTLAVPVVFLDFLTGALGTSTDVMEAISTALVDGVIGASSTGATSTGASSMTGGCSAVVPRVSLTKCSLDLNGAKLTIQLCRKKFTTCTVCLLRLRRTRSCGTRVYLASRFLSLAW